MRLLHAAALLAVAAAARPPNILWLQTDSTDGRLFDPTSLLGGVLKLTDFRASVMDAGYTFTRHYTTSPQCVPSRTSMMTGRYVSETLTTNNGQGIARSTKTGKLDSNCVSEWNETACEAFAEAQNVSATFLDMLAGAGYELDLFGRFDVGAGVLDDYPGTTGDGFHGGPSLDILARAAAIEGVSKPPPLNTTNTGDKNPYAGDEDKVQEAVAYLQAHSPPADKPFLLWVGLIAPHPPYDTNATWETHLNASAFPVPSNLPKDKLHPFDAYQSLVKGCLKFNYSDDDIMKMRTTYWAAAAEGADLLLDVVRAARANGWLDNTVIIITSDHGEMSLEHWQDYKNSMYEPSSRVPLIIVPVNVSSLPAPTPGQGGVLVHNITSHIDIVPTLADLAGVPPIPGARGQSLVPLMRAAAGGAAAPAPPSRRDYAVVEYHSNLAATGSFGIVQGPWKLITYGHTWPWFNATTYVQQLFHTASDPYELTNVADANPDVVASLFATLEAELGGPGSLAAIDARQMQSNVDLYTGFFYEKCTAKELVNAFAGAFKGAASADVDALVTAWAGKSPSTATGPGGTCPAGGSGFASHELGM